MPPRRAKVHKIPEGVTLLESKLPCPECGSSDALAIYSDGHGFCFSHGKIVPKSALVTAGMWADNGSGVHLRGDGTGGVVVKPPSAEIEQILATAKAHPLKSRNLTLASCKRWGYLVRRNVRQGTYEQIAQYYDKAGQVVALKIRGEDKEFRWEGKPNNALLYGQWMWGSGGKYLTITEGEIDAITVSQIFDHKYAVVSVRNGAPNAVKDISAQLEYVNSFDKVILMFDQDDIGKAAAQEVAGILAPGKAFIAWLPEKDPNDCLVKENEEAVRQGFWNATKFKIGGVVDARTLSIKCKQKITVGRPWPWTFMMPWTFGKRPREVYMWGSGTGMGKSDLMAQVSASALTGVTNEGEATKPLPLGLFNYEAIDYQIKLLVAGKMASRRFHIPNMPEFNFDAGWTDAERDATLDYMDGKLWDAGGRLFINEQGFSANWDDIVSRIRYLNKAEEVFEFIIDPIGAIVADMAEEDERKFLDGMMREVASLAQETDATIHMVSHLTRPSFGPSHEEGGQVRLSQFRGSNGIGMFSHYVFGLERNQQAESEAERLKAIVRVVKDRYTGLSTGKTHALYYDPLSGTLDTENEG